MTSWKYLSTVLSTLTVFSACWEAKPGSKSCYLQWGKILSNISMVKRIFREVNILLEGLEIECFFRCFCLKPAFRSNLRCHFAAALFSGVFLAQVCHCRFFAKVCCASSRNVNIPPTRPHPIHCVASNMCASSRNVNIRPTPPRPIHCVGSNMCASSRNVNTHPTPSIA